MNFEINTVIGGEVYENRTVFQSFYDIEIKLKRNLNINFDNFDKLNKLKIWLCVNRNTLEYHQMTGIIDTKYFKTKNNFTATFCINKNYWNYNLSPAEQFLDFMKKYLYELSEMIDKRILISEGYKIITVLLFFVALALFGSKIVF